MADGVGGVVGRADESHSACETIAQYVQSTMRCFTAANPVFFFLMIRPPRNSTQAHTLFPYTTLFRSRSPSPTSTACCPTRTNSSGRACASRSEEHTSELQSRELISYAVFCLKKKK